MKGDFYIADPEDLGRVRLDLNHLGNSEGQGAGFGLLGDLDLGRVEVEPVWITDGPKAGAVQANVRRPVVEMRFRVWFQYDNLDGALTMISKLQRECQRGGFLVFRPEESSLPRFIEFYPSPIPTAFDGSDLIVNKITKLYTSNLGIEVRLWRYPDMFGEIVDLGNADLSNGGLRGIIVRNPGSLPSHCRIKVKPNDEGGKLIDFWVGRRSRGDLNMLSNGVTFRVEDASLFNNTSGNVVDTGASGGEAAETTFGNKRSMLRRWRKVLTAASDADYVGLWRCFVTLRTVGNAGAAEGTPTGGHYKIQLRYGNGDVAPAEVTNDTRDVNFEDVRSFQYITVDLGLVRVKKKKITLEGWTRLVKDKVADPDYALRWDSVTLIPADEDICRVSIPGYMGGHSNETEWNGVELDDVSGTTIGDATAVGTNAVYHENNVRLNEVGEKVRAPDQPEVFPAGHHHFRAKVVLRNKDAETAGNEALRLGWLEVRNAAGTVIEKKALKTEWKRETTELTAGVNFLADGATSYQGLIRMSNDPTDAEARITIRKLKWFYHRYATKAGSNIDEMILDGMRRKAILRNKDLDEVSHLVKKGEYVELAPGDNLLLFHFGEMPPSNYDDVLEGTAESKHDPAKTYKVNVDVEPRYSA